MPKNIKSKRSERRKVSQILRRASGDFGNDASIKKNIANPDFISEHITRNDLEERYLENSDLKPSKNK